MFYSYCNKPIGLVNGSICSVMVTIVGNGHGVPSLNHRLWILLFLLDYKWINSKANWAL